MAAPDRLEAVPRVSRKITSGNLLPAGAEPAQAPAAAPRQRQARGRPLRADQHHRHVDLEHQVQDPGRLLERRRAVADDDAGQIGHVSHQGHAQGREGLPVGKSDRGAGDVAIANRDHVGDQRGIRPFRQNFRRMQHVAGRAVAVADANLGLG